MEEKTLENYDKELRDLEILFDEIEEYLKEHPESQGTAGNYETLKYVYNIYQEDKQNFICNVNLINLKLLKEEINGINIENMDHLSRCLNKTKNLTTNLLEETHDYNENILMTSVCEGSYKITYAFENPTEEDVKRTSPRKKGLMKIFDFINCGDDIEKLKKEAGPNGTEALKAYKEFLKEIIQLDTDFTLDTEMGTVKAGLTLQQSKNICENLTFN